MIKSYKKHLWLIVLLAIGFTGLGFAIDSGPVYAKASTSFIEFIIISTVLFIVLSVVSFFAHYLQKKLF